MKRVCLYFIRRTTQPGKYRFFLIRAKNPYSNQATQKNTCQIFAPEKILRSFSSLEIPSTPLPGPFLRGLYLEGLIFGGTYVRREICVSKSIGLAYSGKEIYHFCFVLLCIREQIPRTSPPGGLYSEGRFNGGFFGAILLFHFEDYKKSINLSPP